MYSPKIYFQKSCGRSYASQTCFPTMTPKIKVKFYLVKRSYKCRVLLGILGISYLQLLSLFKPQLTLQIKTLNSKTKPLHSFSPKTSIDEALKLKGRRHISMFFSINLVVFSSQFRYGSSSLNPLSSRSQFQWFSMMIKKMYSSILNYSQRFLHKIF